MRLLGLSVLMHVVLATVIPSVWWIPNVTLVGLVLAIAQTPTSWLPLSSLAGLSALVWAIRFPLPAFISYLLIGIITRVLITQWDLSDHRLQVILVITANGVSTLSALWLYGVWSLSLLGLAGAQIMMTGLAVPVLRRLLIRETPLRSRAS